MNPDESQTQTEQERTRQNILELLRLVAREIVRRLQVERDGGDPIDQRSPKP